MKIIKNISKINFICLLILGCVPETAYYAYEYGEDAFSALDTQFRVNSLDYPVFHSKADRSSPQPDKQPEIYKKYKWEVTHKVNGKYLIYSNDYDYSYCLMLNKRWKKSINNCEKNGNSINLYMYLDFNGIAYGWQPLRNPKRHLFKSDKFSLFKIYNSGDWSGQPWFECVERCDKLINMK